MRSRKSGASTRRPFGEVEALTWTVENNQRFPGQYADGASA
jgi:hypothetical protein